MYRSCGDPDFEQLMFRYARQVQPYLRDIEFTGSHPAKRKTLKKLHDSAQ